MKPLRSSSKTKNVIRVPETLHLRFFFLKKLFKVFKKEKKRNKSFFKSQDHQGRFKTPFEEDLKTPSKSKMMR